MKTPKWLGSVIALGVCLLMPKLAAAANITFDDTNPNDTITVTGGQFDGGFFVNDNLIQNPSNTESGSTTVNEADGPLSFSGSWIDLGDNAPGFSRTIYLVEASDPTLVSDILQYTVSTDGEVATIAGTFVSDFENNLGHLADYEIQGDVFVEDGHDVNFSAAYLTGQVRSDVDAPVPEPASLLLFATGLPMLRSAIRRKRHAA